MQSILLDIVRLWRSLAKNVQTDHEGFFFYKSCIRRISSIQVYEESIYAAC